MTCGDCYYVGWTKGTCDVRCRHPAIDAELNWSMWQLGCDFKTPNKATLEDRIDKIKPGNGRGEDCGKN